MNRAEKCYLQLTKSIEQIHPTALLYAWENTNAVTKGVTQYIAMLEQHSKLDANTLADMQIMCLTQERR